MKNINERNKVRNKAIKAGLIRALTQNEPHAHYDGDNVIINGTTKRLNDNGQIASYVLKADEYAWLVLVKNCYDFRCDHGNNREIELASGKNTTGVHTALSCHRIENGHERHLYVSTLLNDYPGPGNWSYTFNINR